MVLADGCTHPSFMTIFVKFFTRSVKYIKYHTTLKITGSAVHENEIFYQAKVFMSYDVETTN